MDHSAAENKWMHAFYFFPVMQLVIRRYCPTDKDTVLNIFRDGIKEHISPCFYNAMTSPLYLIITTALCFASYFLGSLLGAVLFPGLWVSIVYYCCHESYSGYVRNRLRTDMQDIRGNYMSRPDDCFWVAEAEVNGRSQILGMVAVVAKQNGEERFGELFRMIISPTCRRMGLGLRMTQTVIDFCKERGFSKVVLGTSSTQKAALALYKRLGFNIVLIHKTTESPYWITLLSQITFVQMEKHL